jgi:hypothetical protein
MNNFNYSDASPTNKQNDLYEGISGQQQESVSKGRGRARERPPVNVRKIPSMTKTGSNKELPQNPNQPTQRSQSQKKP